MKNTSMPVHSSFVLVFISVLPGNVIVSWLRHFQKLEKFRVRDQSVIITIQFILIINNLLSIRYQNKVVEMVTSFQGNLEKKTQSKLRHKNVIRTVYLGLPWIYCIWYTVYPALVISYHTNIPSFQRYKALLYT